MGEKINEYEKEDLPRERLFRCGPEALADYELVAILLRTGTQGEDVLRYSRRILSEVGGLKGLHSIAPQQLLSIKGIAEGKAAGLLAAAELGRRYAKIVRSDEKKPRIHSPEDVFELVQYEMSALPHEELWVLNLDTKHYVNSIDHVYRGTVNASSIRVAELFRKPILNHSAAIILVHNHPSGDPQPSAADLVTTRSVMEAGKLLEIPMLDHVIVGKGKFESLNKYLS